MEPQNEKGEVLLPHHEQQSLCTTRLPYRQGRKLTAVKVYTVNNESNHLLIFGVPSLNLRQEAKSLFTKFGKLKQFNISKMHAADMFTDTYHAVFEKIQSARLAKRMLDTKNFYGGSLHVCYAPELEDLNETRNKLLHRQKDVIFRLRNLQKTNEVPEITKQVDEPKVVTATVEKKLNMGDINTINLENNSVKKRKIKREANIEEKRLKPCFVSNPRKYEQKKCVEVKNSTMLTNSDFRLSDDNCIEIVDCTSTNLETVTNISTCESIDVNKPEIMNEIQINDSLNYNNFGNEVVKKVPVKAVNKIQFNLNKRSS